MRLDTYFKDKKVLGLIIVIIVCIISIPFFTYSVPYELNRTVPNTGRTGKAGETVEFIIIFEQIGGNSDKVIEITNIDKVGDWDVISGGRTVIVHPDSFYNVTISVNIPEDANNWDEYYFDYELQGDYQDNGRLTVVVDNNDPPELNTHFGSSRGMQGSSDLALSPFVFILEAIIVSCVILLFIFVKKSKDNEKESEPSQN